MKTDKLTLTIEELDQLCRLYMDCKLSVLEEKELEYILCTTPLTSASIAEVKALMNIQVHPASDNGIRRKRFLNWKYVTGIAASIAVILTVTLHFTATRTSSLHDSNSNMYIAAYSSGKRLSDSEAVRATNLAMAKADSLMNYALLTEHEYMLRANNIIDETLNN